MKTSALYKEAAGIGTSLKPGVPLSKQLGQERKKIENLQYRRKAKALTKDKALSQLLTNYHQTSLAKSKQKQKSKGSHNTSCLEERLDFTSEVCSESNVLL